MSKSNAFETAFLSLGVTPKFTAGTEIVTED